MKRGILILILGWLVFNPLLLWAGDEDGGDAVAFLKNGVGCRSISLGKAFIAIADDANAIYYNPAGLVQLRSKEFTMMYSTPFFTTVEGIDYHTLGYAHPVKDQVLGISIISLKVRGIPKVSDLEKGPEGEFSDQEWALLLSYAQSIKAKLSLGATLKIINQNIDQVKKDCLSLDLGIMANLGKRIKLALVVGDFVSNKLGEDKIPVKFKLGISWRLSQVFILAIASDYTLHRSLKHHFGIEGNIFNHLVLRAGYSSDNKEISGGVGIKILKSQIDWGYGLNKDLGNTQRISLTLKF